MNSGARLVCVLRPLLLGAAGLLLGGCESIGEGNRIQKFTIEPSTGRTWESPYRVYECFREGVSLIATFTDGTRGNFSGRARWHSSNTDVVRVSNNDEPLVVAVSGGFQTIERLSYQRGTLIPVAPGTATITAEYLGRSTTLEVEVRTPELHVVEAPVTEAPVPGAVHYMGVGTTRDFTLVADFDGRLTDVAVFGSQHPVFNSTLNPVLWSFDEPGNRYVSSQASATDQFQLVDDPAAPGLVLATISPSNGVVTARTVDNNTYTVQAQIGACPDNDSLTARTEFRIAHFAANTPLSLQREQGYTGSQLVLGTNELLRVTANLDLDGDGNGDPGATQDIGSQIKLDVEPKDACTTDSSGEPVCLSSVFNVNSSPGNLLQTVPGSAGGPGFIRACFPDCEDDPDDPDDRVRVSNVLSLSGTPAGLDEIVLCPAEHVNLAATPVCSNPVAPPQEAFTVPAQRFEAIGIFDGGSLRQKITRSMSWFARPEGSEDEFAEAITLSNGLRTAGQVFYLQNVLEPTPFGIHALPLRPFETFEEPPPAQLTVTPCGAPDYMNCPIPPPAEND